MEFQPIRDALSRDKPGHALRNLVLSEAARGRSKDEIIQWLDDFVVSSRTASGWKEADEDVVLDTLDALAGWCSPSAQLLGHPEKDAVRVDESN